MLLDLDETLIHSQMLKQGEPVTENFTFVIDINSSDGRTDVSFLSKLSDLE